ncbi:MAG: hypothetical protein VKP70_00485 [Cyanobacteriota bacterium]|nr:hypothetical protein [Cyanobacteriota bacterium]
MAQTFTGFCTIEWFLHDCAHDKDCNQATLPATRSVDSITCNTFNHVYSFHVQSTGLAFKRAPKCSHHSHLMSQRKTGVFSLAGRLNKSLATSVFALSAFAGGIAINSGAAQAQNFMPCSFGANPTSPLCNDTIIYDTTNSVGAPFPTDKTLDISVIPTSGSGDIEFKWIDVNNNGTWYTPSDEIVDEWHVDVDFNPDLLGTTSTFEYIISINKSVPHIDWFSDVTLGSIFGPGGDASVTKDIFSVVNGGKGILLGSILNTGTFTLTPNTYDQLYIVDTATSGTTTIDAYQNVYRQVPGPLPILGAGAAFGFSRKLRSRIKGVRTA